MKIFWKLLLGTLVLMVLYLASEMVLFHFNPSFCNTYLGNLTAIVFVSLFVIWTAFIYCLPIVLIIALIYRLIKGFE